MLLGNLGRAAQSSAVMARVPSRNPKGVRVWYTKDLPDHVQLIGLQVWKSVRDPRMQDLARVIAAGSHARVDLLDDREWDDGRKVWVRGGSGKSRTLSVPDSGSPCTTEECLINRVFYFTRANMQYKEDPPDVDLFMSAAVGLFNGLGDCDDHVIVHTTLLKLMGFRVGCEVISTDGGEWEHIYALVGLPRANASRWIPLDTAAPQVNPNSYPGWRLASCPKSGTCATHRWSREFNFVG